MECTQDLGSRPVAKTITRKMNKSYFAVTWLVSLLVLFMTPALRAENAPLLNPETQVPSAQSAAVDLLSYMHSHIDSHLPDSPDASVPKYDRKQHFGTWMHPDSSRACANTRELVLERDADRSVAIQYKTPQNCIVTSGLWHDPYTGTDFQSATDIQIDHVVPLRAAYYAGAHAWSPAGRCNYANFTANNFHLMSVSGHENMAKGDRAPDGYMPPNREFQCQYVSNWMKIKLIWQLSASSDEVQAIEDVMTKNHCDPSLNEIASSELSQQRTKAATPIDACLKFQEELMSSPEAASAVPFNAEQQ
jgi:5-methylcytosine-specific restriction endonuclease McrA